jgi:Helix-turn-helix domain
MRKLYTPQEYAEVRQCSLKTLERERTAGTGCPYVLIGRRIYYREEHIEAFLAGRVRRSTSEPPPINAVMP